MAQVNRRSTGDIFTSCTASIRVEVNILSEPCIGAVRVKVVLYCGDLYSCR